MIGIMEKMNFVVGTGVDVNSVSEENYEVCSQIKSYADYLVTLAETRTPLDTMVLCLDNITSYVIKNTPAKIERYYDLYVESLERVKENYMGHIPMTYRMLDEKLEKLDVILRDLQGLK